MIKNNVVNRKKKPTARVPLTKQVAKLEKRLIKAEALSARAMRAARQETEVLSEETLEQWADLFFQFVQDAIKAAKK